MTYISTGFPCGPRPLIFGPKMLSTLYGISEKKAEANRDILVRVSRMKPEARKYMLKLVLENRA